MTTGKAIRTNTTTCPECEETISLSGTVEWGQQVVCPHCDTALEVINTNPLELDWVFDDYDYDEYDDEDDEDDY